MSPIDGLQSLRIFVDFRIRERAVLNRRETYLESFAISCSMLSINLKIIELLLELLVFSF